MLASGYWRHVTHLQDMLASNSPLICKRHSVDNVHQIQAALPCFETSFVDTFDQVSVFVDEGLLAFAFGFFCGLLVLRNDLKASVEQVSTKECNGRLAQIIGLCAGDAQRRI